MNVDRKALYGGIALIAAVPMLLFWQSSNPSKGTSPGRTEYNVDHVISILNEKLCEKQPAALNLFCDFTIDSSRRRNAAYAETWIEFTAELCGECADVLVSRGRLCELRGDRDGMERAFLAARAAVRGERERRRIDAVIAHVDDRRRMSENYAGDQRR